MLDILLARFRQGHRTMAYPDAPPPALPERFRGRPVIDASKCPDGCAKCAQACPTQAISINGVPRIDLGRCLFCADCMEACPEEAIRYTREYRLAVRQRQDLVVDSQQELKLAAALDQKLMKLPKGASVNAVFTLDSSYFTVVQGLEELLFPYPRYRKADYSVATSDGALIVEGTPFAEFPFNLGRSGKKPL